jgi:nicotinamidase-related amidase
MIHYLRNPKRKESTMTVHGLIIDPQEDFCNPATGALFVPGAEKDMARLAAMIRRIKGKVDDIHASTRPRSPSLRSRTWTQAGGRRPSPEPTAAAVNMSRVWSGTGATPSASGPTTV